jgi:predicted transposase YbfD/YdcC
MNDVALALDGDVVALDGKSLRGSFDRASRKNALHMVSAWSCTGGVALGQVKSSEKSNEITAIPRLLELLELKKCIVTIDAIGCQKGIVESILAKKADYILGVKRNQPALYDDFVQYFDKHLLLKDLPAGIGFFETLYKAHGRLEKRRCWQSTELQFLPAAKDWKGIRSVLRIESERSMESKTSKEVRYFISSLPLNPERALSSIRQHWFVENQLHWVLDVTFGEDKSRIRRGDAPENMGVLRRLALNICKKCTTNESTPRKLRKAGWDDAFREKLLFGRSL